MFGQISHYHLIERGRRRSVVESADFAASGGQLVERGSMDPSRRRAMERAMRSFPTFRLRELPFRPPSEWVITLM